MLTQEEIKIIALIDERLKYYNFIQADAEKEPILQGFAPKIEEQSRYVKCVKEPTVFIGGLKVGKVYKELSGVNGDSIYVIDEMGDKCGYYSDCFERVTEAEFLAQTAAQQEPKEWKVNEWVKKENGYIGIVTDISIHTLTVDPQDGINEDYMGMTEAIKPTDKEVETWLTKIAEKRYPKGCVLNIDHHTRSNELIEKVKIITQSFEMLGRDLVYYEDKIGYVLWNSDTQKWAAIINESKVESAKETAFKVAEKHYWLFGDGYLGKQHIQHALIEVESILNFYEEEPTSSQTGKDYWLEVKKQLLKTL
jgi:hypothetical protein